MKNPYLVQRGRMRYDTARKGLDSLITFDYMGSAEFEFGALPRSLKRIREGKKFRVWQTDIFERKISILSNQNALKVEKMLRELAEGKYQTQEYTSFDRFCNPNFGKCDSNFWWDIENDIMWWAQDRIRDEEIKKAVLF